MTLPDELWVEILKRIEDPRELINMAVVSREMYSMAKPILSARHLADCFKWNKYNDADEVLYEFEWVKNLNYIVYLSTVFNLYISRTPDMGKPMAAILYAMDGRIEKIANSELKDIVKLRVIGRQSQLLDALLPTFW
jgi:hypothetical protein